MNKTAEKQWTVSSLLDWTADYFANNGISEGRLDAEILLSDVLNCDRLSLYLKKSDTLTEKELSSFKAHIIERKTRKPVSYILGWHEFMGLRFEVNKHTLIPRPETELLVEEVLRIIKENDFKVAADIGSGSGNICVSVARFSEIEKMFACDISRDALNICWRNAVFHGLASKIVLKYGDILTSLADENVKGKIDIIVSNPPYITADEFVSLEPELGFEPKLALHGGFDGLVYYRKIAQQAGEYLVDGGYIVLELNSGKAEETTKIFEAKGFKKIKLIKDYSGLDRVLVLKLWTK